MAFKSNFQRSQSKVWWGQYPERDEYGFVALPQPPTATSSLPKSASSHKASSSKLTPPEITTTSWSYRRGSPGSFKSHDSGFSDSDQSPPSVDPPQQPNSSTHLSSSSTSSPNTPKRGTAANRSDTSSSSSAPSSGERSTPPTVIRKKAAATDVNPSLCRRISFSAPSSPIYERIDADLLSQIDSIQYASTSPVGSSKRDASWADSSLEEAEEEEEASSGIGERKTSQSLKRSKVIRRSANRTERTLLRCVSQISIESTDDFYQAVAAATSDDQRVPSLSTTRSAGLDEPAVMMQTAIPQTPRSILKIDRPAYNNETVVFGAGGAADADATSSRLHDTITSTDYSINQSRHVLPTYAELYPAQTSTPKAANNSATFTRPPTEDRSLLELAPTISWDECTYYEYSNPLLNGHSSSIQAWLDDTRRTYAHEVLATLQTKSIAANAARYADLNSAMAGRLIRQLQQRAHALQLDFEYVERLLADAVDDDALLKELPEQLGVLHANVLQCTQKMSVRTIFGVPPPSVSAAAAAEAAAELVRFRNNVACIADMSYDLVRVASVRDLSEVEPLGLLEDVRMLRRYVLITLRIVFERLVRVIVDRIEEVRCDLILRSNLSLVAMLSNAAYGGFASLNAAFVATRAIRVLLAVCDESKLPTIRVLALRALTTISCSRETIAQFEACGGTEILVDVLCEEEPHAFRTEPEQREALSVFAQITAGWHGAEHRLDGVRPLVEKLVTRLTAVATETGCCQTLLLAVASLNNMARMETTAIYSLMSNETVLRLRSAVERRGPGASVFLYEQLVSMLAHMTGNKRCHPHLTNKAILGFITGIYHTQAAARYDSAAETAAQQRITRAVLDIFARLLRQSAANKDVMEQSVALLFVRVHERLRADESRLSETSRGLVADISAMLAEQGRNRATTTGDMQPMMRRNGEQRGSARSTTDDGKKLLESYV